jgi:hypothetical protein
MAWITDGFQVGRVIGLGMCPAQLGGLGLADDVVDHAGQGDAVGALAALALAFIALYHLVAHLDPSAVVATLVAALCAADHQRAFSTGAPTRRAAARSAVTLGTKNRMCALVLS